MFQYGGRPSWVFAPLDGTLPPGRCVATLRTRSGATSVLGTFELGRGADSFGAATPLNPLDVTQLRLRAEREGTLYVARFR